MGGGTVFYGVNVGHLSEYMKFDQGLYYFPVTAEANDHEVGGLIQQRFILSQF